MISTRLRGWKARAPRSLGWLILCGFGVTLSVFAAAGSSGLEPGAPRPDPYAAMHALELRITAWVQRWPGLGKPMEWISHLGPGKPMLGLAAVLLCLVGPGFARRFAVLLVLCLWARELLAMVLQSPRPYWFGEGVRTFRDPPLSVATFGLPSGHATTAAAVWFFLAAEVRRRWAWGLAVAIVGSVAVSRVYLGVHFTSDVVLGVVLGSAGAVAFRRLEGPVSARWSALGGSGRSMAAVAVASGTLLVSAAVQAWVTRAVPEGAWPPYGATARVSTGCAWAAGAIFGAALAAVDPVRWSAESDRWRWRWQRLALTVAPAAFYFVRPDGWRLSAWLPGASEPAKWGIRFVSAAFLGWAALWLLPMTFRRLGWAPSPAASRSDGVLPRSTGPRVE